MKRFLIVLLCGFLATFTLGCGSSNNDFQNDFIQGGPQPAPTSAVGVFLTEDDLVDILPLVVPQTSSEILDDAGVEFWSVFIFDTAGQIVDSFTFDRVPGEGIDVIFEGIVPFEVDVIVDALDSEGNILASAEAVGVFLDPGFITELTVNDFDPILDVFNRKSGK